MAEGRDLAANDVHLAFAGRFLHSGSASGVPAVEMTTGAWPAYAVPAVGMTTEA